MDVALVPNGTRIGSLSIVHHVARFAPTNLHKTCLASRAFLNGRVSLLLSARLKLQPPGFKSLIPAAVAAAFAFRLDLQYSDQTMFSTDTAS
jgi:hypothetical protein